MTSSFKLCGFSDCASAAAAVCAVAVVVVAASSAFSVVACIIAIAEVACSVSTKDKAKKDVGLARCSSSSYSLGDQQRLITDLKLNSIHLLWF
jgi:hypothetical protein